MLGYLKKKQEAGMSAPVDKVERKPDHEVDFDILESAAQDVMDAFENKDVKALAIALRAAFEICDSEPHMEGPHIEDGE